MSESTKDVSGLPSQRFHCISGKSQTGTQTFNTELLWIIPHPDLSLWGSVFPKHLHIHSESDAWSDIPAPGKLKFSMNHYKSPHLENVPGRKYCQYSLLGCRLAESTRHIGFRTNAEMNNAAWATGCIPQIPEFRAVTQDRIRVTPLVCSRHNCFLLPPSVQIIWQLKSKFK